MLTVSYYVLQSVDSQRICLICPHTWNVHLGMQWTECRSRLPSGTSLIVGKEKWTSAICYDHASSQHIHSCVPAHQHMCNKYISVHVMYLVVCQAESVSIHLCLCLHACLCFAHSCLINIPSEAHLVCFEEARGAASARAGPAAVPPH